MIHNKRILVIIKYVFLILVLVFVAKFMVTNIRDLDKITIKIDYRYIVAAYLVHLIYLVSRASLWHYITCLIKVQLPFDKALSVWFISMLGKFIPGKVFYLGTRVYHYKKNGKSGSLVTYSFFIEYLASIAASMLLFVVSFSLIPATSLDQYRGVGIILIFVILLLLHPKMVNFAVGMINRNTKMRLPYIANIKYGNVVFLVFLYLVSWGLLGLGFFLLVNSVVPIPFSELPYVAGSFALATIIGILALFAPSGIGVREAVVIATLTQIIAAGIASIISLLARIWATSSELFWICAVYLITKIKPAKLDKDTDREE
jgi:hypothetical protein